MSGGVNHQMLLRPTFAQRRRLKVSARVRRFMGIVAHLWKDSFFYCLASAEAACESSLLNRLSKAKAAKALINCLLWWKPCVCVNVVTCACDCLPGADIEMNVVLKCLPCLCLLCRFMRFQWERHWLVHGIIYWHYAEYSFTLGWLVRYTDNVRACVCTLVCLGHISLSSSTVELFFDERVIPALIESWCSLSPFNGLPVIIPSFFWALKKKSEL